MGFHTLTLVHLSPFLIVKHHDGRLLGNLGHRDTYPVTVTVTVTTNINSNSKINPALILI